MLILNILDILKKYSDENHRISARDIGERLEREYAQRVDRKAIKRNLMNLIDFGYDIEYTETVRTKKNGEEETVYSGWYLNREFIDAELRLLIDGLLFSKHIPGSQCSQLIEKLEGLSNTYFRSKAKHILTMPELPENRELFYTIEILDEAISAGRQVAFYYNEHGIDKKQHPRKNSDGSPKEYEVSPYQMAAANGRYYLIGKGREYPDTSNYRVDRIADIRILDLPATPMRDIPELKNGLNLPKHMAERIYMFSGESAHVRFRAKPYLISDIIDWFGRDVRLREDAGGSVLADVRVNEQAMFYWSMQYGGHIEVLEPQRLREKLGRAAAKIAAKYNENNQGGSHA